MIMSKNDILSEFQYFTVQYTYMYCNLIFHTHHTFFIYRVKIIYVRNDFTIFHAVKFYVLKFSEAEKQAKGGGDDSSMQPPKAPHRQRQNPFNRTQVCLTAFVQLNC